MFQLLLQNKLAQNLVTKNITTIVFAWETIGQEFGQREYLWP